MLDGQVVLFPTLVMSVLEICLLKVRDSIHPTEPALLFALQKARTGLKEKVINTHSRFYQCIDDPSRIYILGIWPSLGRHHEFLASPEKSAILDSQEESFDFGWVIHVPMNEMEDLPLKAPVLDLGYFRFKEGQDGRFGDVWAKYRDQVVECTNPYPVMDGWRVDVNKGDLKEFVVLTGWEEKEFTAKTRPKYHDYASVRETCDSWEVVHLKDMESNI
jgi:hypothetical protein